MRRRPTGILLAAAIGVAANASAAGAQNTAAPAPPVRAQQVGTFRNPRVVGGLMRANAASQPSTAAALDTVEDSLGYVPQPTPTGGPASPQSPLSTFGSPPIAMSRRQAAVLWTFNPGSRDAEIYASDTLGHDFGTFEITGINNIAWQAIAEGPCGRDTCIYIGDLGDPSENRRSIALYRFPEPVVAHDRLPRVYAVTHSDSLQVHYPNGPHDASAMIVNQDGSVDITTNGKSRGVQIFRVRMESWFNRRGVIADSLGRITLNPRAGLGFVTGAAASPNGAVLAFRTAHAILFVARGPKGEPTTTVPTAVCDIHKLQAPGQGLDWVDNDELVLSAMRGFSPMAGIFLVKCPLTP